MKATLQKLGIFITGTFVMGIIYKIVSLWTLERSTSTSLMTPIDQAIPFIPETVVIYMSVYLFCLIPIVAKDIPVKAFWKMIVVAGAVFFLSSIGHIVMPSAYPRPTISDTMAQANWAEFLVKNLVYLIDPPNNTFPSLHVTIAAILMIMMRNKMSAFWYRIYCLWGALIIFSTLTVKQHYLLDVLAGLFLVFAIRYLVKKHRQKIHRDIPDIEDIN